MIKVNTRWVYKGNLEEDLNIAVAAEAKPFLQSIGDTIRDRIDEMLSRPGSGEMYRSKRRDGTMHIASAPGEPPAPDTDRYRNSIRVRVVVFKYVYRVAIESRLWRKFGRRLEFGGTGGGVYIAPRPHMRPAVASVIPGAHLERESVEGDEA